METEDGSNEFNYIKLKTGLKESVFFFAWPAISISKV
jgi:hypothetical protein